MLEKLFRKKTCIIHANCFGEHLKHFLLFSKPFANRYSVKTYMNFTKEYIPDKMLRQCNLFIYQYLDEKWGEFASENLIKKLHPSCRKISIPSPYWRSLWPFSADYKCDARNVSDEKYPFGKHPYVESYLLKQIEERKGKEDIIKTYLHADINLLIDLNRLHNDDITRETWREKDLDVKIVDFIVKNFQARQLLTSVNHPTNFLILQIANQVLHILNYPSVSEEQIKNEPELGEYHVPIHPFIAKWFKLPYAKESTKYLTHGKMRTYAEYLNDYIEYQ